MIPAARVIGCGGAGTEEGAGKDPANAGGGGGFGIGARPAGVLIIEPGGTVRWKGIFDVNRVIVGAQIVCIAGLAFAWLTERTKARAAMKASIAAAAIERVGRRHT